MWTRGVPTRSAARLRNQSQKSTSPAATPSGGAAVAENDPVGRRDNRSHQTLGASRHNVQIEPDEFVAGLDLGAWLDLRFETSTAETHRVDADVNQHIYAEDAADGDGMAAIRQSSHFSRTRGADDAGRRINGEAVAEHAPGKHGVWDLIEGAAPAVERRDDSYRQRLLPDLYPIERQQRIKARPRKSQAHVV